MTTADPIPQLTQPLLLRIDDAARLLSLGRATIYKMIANGELPVVKCGTALRIPLDDLKAWIDARTEYQA
jgi:excisionase family DNA binding protein